jgi:hypothetical protein
VATKPRRSATGTGRIDPGSTESVHRFISIAGALHGAIRHGGSDGMIPSNHLSGRTRLRALADKPAGAVPCTDLQY